jgi:hypothetical protein
MSIHLYMLVQETRPSLGVPIFSVTLVDGSTVPGPCIQHWPALLSFLGMATLVCRRITSCAALQVTDVPRPGDKHKCTIHSIHISHGVELLMFFPEKLEYKVPEVSK